MSTIVFDKDFRVPPRDEAAENAKIMRSIILHDLSNPLLFHGQRSFTSGIIFLTIYDFTHSPHYIWDKKSGKKCRNLEKPAIVFFFQKPKVNNNRETI